LRCAHPPIEGDDMSLTQNGLGVADGIRGTTSAGPGAATGPEHPDPPPPVIEDGFLLRSRAGTPQRPSAPAAPVVGRLDEVTAPEGAEPADEPPAMQLAARRAVQPAPDAAAAVAKL
jgi:hypothetical protein